MTEHEEWGARGAEGDLAQALARVAWLERQLHAAEEQARAFTTEIDEPDARARVVELERQLRAAEAQADAFEVELADLEEFLRWGGLGREFEAWRRRSDKSQDKSQDRETRRQGDKDPRGTAVASVITEDTEPRLPPRPILFVAPRAIADRVARELAAYSEEARQRTLTHWTLDYYFRDMPGVPVAYRPRPEGAEVLALGFEEVTAFQKDMPLEEQRKYTFGQTP